ncbi:hypothetical protein PSHT_00226 [Puccinia striiformis]|uniref:Uncharacterized protein n=1 Tax=Puccinia striiformis TaxID=27350 RepID=A0A2S4WNG6_9BASI|nr:hypothetical protein KEM48_000470 [Puccinia striiformis f. sp. tritici PST-130]POW23325.1 hypothetical protein PSHT_00226 [Puccinia striiformis]
MTPVDFNPLTDATNHFVTTSLQHLAQAGMCTITLFSCYWGADHLVQLAPQLANPNHDIQQFMADMRDGMAAARDQITALQAQVAAARDQITALQAQVAAGRAEAQFHHLHFIALRDKTRANHRQMYQRVEEGFESINRRLDHLEATNRNWLLGGRLATQRFLPPPAR